MKFSFVVPVYNVSEYLRQCVESITLLKDEELEVILVDDGSTDGCSELCDILAKEDSRVKCFHIPNGGLSNARNYGMRCVTGDYLMFVDGDDYLVWYENALTKVSEMIEQNQYPDILMYGHYSAMCGREKVTLKKYADYDSGLCAPLSPAEAIKLFYKTGYIHISAWAKMLKVSMLKTNDIMFVDGDLEDWHWFVDIMETAKKVVCVNNFPYVYRINRPGSIMTAHTRRLPYDRMLFVEVQVKKIADRQMTHQMKEDILSMIAYAICIIMSELHYCDKPGKSALYDKIRIYEWLLSYRSHPRVKIIGIIYDMVGLRLTSELLQLLSQAMSFRKRYVL